ncbi:PAS domain-containing protein [bacterium]|nr:PAS domain-containing protein [bacterium]MBU1651384.1 PAS domain-containing protein [bacterium]
MDQSVSGNTNHIAPPGHPVHTLMTEHERLLGFAAKLVITANELQSTNNYDSAGEKLDEIRALIDLFKDSEKHYLREENVIFAYLDKHEVSGPTQVMWTEHDGIRDLKKQELYPLIDQIGSKPYADFTSELSKQSRNLQQRLMDHFFKENNILFPMALDVLSESEWEEVTAQFKQIGYCEFSPISNDEAEQTATGVSASEGEIQFSTGTLSAHVLENMINALPIELTFIDDQDSVRYFSQPDDMLFTRTAAVIGNKVQNCHPQKSVHLVNQIVAEFKSGSRDLAEFWIDMAGKKVHIRYFAVRDDAGKYLGCVEMTQDISEIQKIEGQKRLL